MRYYIQQVQRELDAAIKADGKGYHIDLDKYASLCKDLPREQHETENDRKAKIFECSVKDTIEDGLVGAMMKLNYLCEYFNIDVERITALKKQYENGNGKLHSH